MSTYRGVRARPLAISAPHTLTFIAAYTPWNPPAVQTEQWKKLPTTDHTHTAGRWGVSCESQVNLVQKDRTAAGWRGRCSGIFFLSLTCHIYHTIVVCLFYCVILKHMVDSVLLCRYCFYLAIAGLTHIAEILLYMSEYCQSYYYMICIMFVTAGMLYWNLKSLKCRFFILCVTDFHGTQHEACVNMQCAGQGMRTSKGSAPWWQHWEEEKTRPSQQK